MALQTLSYPLDSSSTLTFPVTVLLAVRNEEANIRRCLKSLARAQHTIVVDSGSTDRTPEIASELGAEVVQFQFQGGYPKKRQWALDNLEFPTEWILLLDADEVIPELLWREIAAAIADANHCNGFLIRKGFHFLGRRLRHGGFSHQAVLLVRKGFARFEELVEVPGDSLDMEVHERVIVDGKVGVLNTPLIHEDFKGLESYIDKHNRYSTWEAHLRYQLLTTGKYGSQSVTPRLLGNAQERRRWLKRLAVRMPLEPWLWFIYHYIVKFGFLEGRAGFVASQIRSQYIANVRAKIAELDSQKKR